MHVYPMTIRMKKRNQDGTIDVGPAYAHKFEAFKEAEEKEEVECHICNEEPWDW